MIIRPVTDLRNHFPDVERELQEAGEIYLTKNGYGAAVLLSMEEYKALKGRSSLPPDPQKMDNKSYRGIFHKYANPALVDSEKDAGRIHVLENWKKYTPEGRDEE